MAAPKSGLRAKSGSCPARASRRAGVKVCAADKWAGLGTDTSDDQQVRDTAQQAAGALTSGWCLLYRRGPTRPDTAPPYPQDIGRGKGMVDSLFQGWGDGTQVRDAAVPAPVARIGSLEPLVAPSFGGTLQTRSRPCDPARR